MFSPGSQSLLQFRACLFDSVSWAVALQGLVQRAVDGVQFLDGNAFLQRVDDIAQLGPLVGGKVRDRFLEFGKAHRSYILLSG